MGEAGILEGLDRGEAARVGEEPVRGVTLCCCVLRAAGGGAGGGQRGQRGGAGLPHRLQRRRPPLQQPEQPRTR